MLFFIIAPAMAIIWSIIFIPIALLNIKLYKITGKKMQIFSKKIRIASIWTNNEPDGWICGIWYIGYIHKSSSGGNDSNDLTTVLYILCRTKFYKTYIDLKDIESDGKEPPQLLYYEREGGYYNRSEYSERIVKPPTRIPRNSQSNAVTQIVNIYKDKSNAIALLYGKAGTGKSMTAQYICSELLKFYDSVAFVDTYNPFEQGNNFSSLYTHISPSEIKPLVIMLEEIDCGISMMHYGKIAVGACSPIQIRNKPDWNSFFDKIDRGLYPYIILIMTSNKSINYFNDLDESYMRIGRVDTTIEF